MVRYQTSDLLIMNIHFMWVGLIMLYSFTTTTYHVFTITGLLSAPTNLRSYSNNTAIHVTWKAPPTLDLTNIDPDIMNYVITTHNLQTGHRTSTTKTNTHYVHWPDLELCTLESCLEYIDFRVSAVNIVGRGNESESTQASFHKGIHIIYKVLISGCKSNCVAL